MGWVPTLAARSAGSIQPNTPLQTVGGPLRPSPAGGTELVEDQFLDGDFRWVKHARNPGSSRSYASVLRGGVVSVGDQIISNPN